MQRIVKNTATARDRTLLFEAFDTDGVKKAATGATMRIAGTTAAAQDCDNAPTQIDSSCVHSIVLTQAESNVFEIGEEGVLILPATGGFQEMSFPFVCLGYNPGDANTFDETELRDALGMSAADLDSQIGALPTNAELATALGTADDAVLTAIAALNNLSSAGAQSAAAAALAAYNTTGVAKEASVQALPSASAIATAVWAAGTRTLTSFATLASDTATAVWSAVTRTLSAGTNIVLAKGTGVTGFNDLDAAGVRTAVGLASANLDSQLDALPTNTELATALGTADDATLTVVNAIKAKTDNLPSDPADQSLIMTAIAGISIGTFPTAEEISDTVNAEAKRIALTLAQTADSLTLDGETRSVTRDDLGAITEIAA